MDASLGKLWGRGHLNYLINFFYKKLKCLKKFLLRYRYRHPRNSTLFKISILGVISKNHVKKGAYLLELLLISNSISVVVIVLKVLVDFVSLFSVSFDCFSVAVGFVGIKRRFSQYFGSSIAWHLRNSGLVGFKKTDLILNEFSFTKNHFYKQNQFKFIKTFIHLYSKYRIN